MGGFPREKNKSFLALLQDLQDVLVFWVWYGPCSGMLRGLFGYVSEDCSRLLEAAKP